MPLTKLQIEKTKKVINQMSPLIARQSHCCFVMSDPGRFKMLIVLKLHYQLSVPDLAEILALTGSAVSRQLKKLLDSWMVDKVKSGKNVFYSLNKKSQIFQCLSHFQKLRI